MTENTPTVAGSDASGHLLMHVRDPQKREVVSRRDWDLSAPLISDAAQDSNRHSKSKTKRTVTNVSETMICVLF